MINLCLATGHLGREGSGCAMITGQGNGQGGREHGQKCDQLPGQRSITDPEGRAHVAKVWGITADEIPQAGYSAVEIMEAIHRGEIKALLSICFNPLVSLPDANLHARGPRETRVLRRHRFLHVGNRAACRRGDGRQSAGGRRGRRLQRRGPRDPHPAGGDAARQRAGRQPDHLRPGRRLGKKAFFPYTHPREIFDELREASRGGVADYYGITYERIDKEQGVFWPCPSLDHPGTPRLFDGGVSMHPDGKCRFLPTPWRESGDPLDAEFPIYLTTGRVVSQYLSGTQTRRIGGLVEQYPEPLRRDPSASRRASRASCPATG